MPMAQRLSLLPLEEEGSWKQMPLRIRSAYLPITARGPGRGRHPGRVGQIPFSPKADPDGPQPQALEEMGAWWPTREEVGGPRPARRSCLWSRRWARNGRPAVLPLIAALDNPTKLRERAAMALGLTGYTRAAEPLIAALYDSWDVQDSAETALVRIFEEHPNQLIPFLRSRYVRVYRRMLHLGAPSTVTTLLKALETFGDESMATAFFEPGQRNPSRKRRSSVTRNVAAARCGSSGVLGERVCAAGAP